MSNVIKLDLPKVQKAALELAKEKGFGFVYEKPESRDCQYVEYDLVPREGDEWYDDIENVRPSCYVGQILDRLGFDVGYFTEHFAMNTEPVDEVLYCLGPQGHGEIEYDEDVEHFLKILQFNQDRGHSWGDALEKANEAVGK